MRIYNINGVRYVKIEDVMNMLRSEVLKARNGEGYYKNLKHDERMGVSVCISHLRVLMHDDELSCAHTVDEHKKVLDIDRHGTTNETKVWAVVVPMDDQLSYLRKFCKHVPKYEGESVPVFSDLCKDCKPFTDYELAQYVAESIRENYTLKARVVPYYMVQCENGRNFLEWLYDVNTDADDSTEGDADADE